MFRVPKATMPASTTTSPINSLAKHLKQQHRPCSYTSYECNQPCLDSYSYCSKHILEDPNAPYKQCNFIHSINGRKCQNPAPKTEKREITYCAEHYKKAHYARAKVTTKHSLPETPETLLLGLGHYVISSEKSSIKTEKPVEAKDEIFNPFTGIDAHKINSSRGTALLDYASSSDSDVEPTLTTDTVRGTYLDDSDDDSLHSPEEDPLRHAGVYTAEEVVYITKEKLMRLQTLYLDQFKRLHYVLREKRRKYIQALKKEKESLCSIHDQAKESAKEKKIYAKLKALNSYHKRSGVEAILHKKFLERRAKQKEGAFQKAPSMQKCIFTEGGVKCGERTLPSSKYCRKHILKDQNQVLFKACGAIEADMPCHEPVPLIFDSNCVFHLQVPCEIKLEPIKIKEELPHIDEPIKTEENNTEVESIGQPHEIDPDDDMAGIMREMNDVVNKKTLFNESIASETSTDTAFSLSTPISEKDDLAQT